MEKDGWKMKGYNSIKQFVDDYNLFRIAKNIDQGRDDGGETITSIMKKRVSQRFSNASKQFKSVIHKRGYTENDLKFIAVHDSIKEIRCLEEFIRKCFENRNNELFAYKAVLSSNAFKSGRLRQLNHLIPLKIDNKTEFIRFLKSRRELPKAELEQIMNIVCGRRWRAWLYELIDKGKIFEKGGRWFI